MTASVDGVPGLMEWDVEDGVTLCVLFFLLGQECKVCPLSACMGKGVCSGHGLYSSQIVQIL
jgi:hypothetical protein